MWLIAKKDFIAFSGCENFKCIWMDYVFISSIVHPNTPGWTIKETKIY
jgi:hypothetical protein